MNRRHFLRAALIGAGAVVLAPLEPIRTYFLAPMGGWRPGEITPAMMRAIAAPFTLNDPESGISMRMVREFNALTDKDIKRMDVLYGVGRIRPDQHVVNLTTEYSLKPVETFGPVDPKVIEACAKRLADHIDQQAFDAVYRRYAVNVRS